MSELPLGALVQWVQAPGSPAGVVVEADAQRVHVRFDGDSAPKIFSAKAGVIQRVSLSGTVRRVSTGTIGFVHGQTSASPPRWQVFLDGHLVTVAEADLRPHVLDDPHSRILDGRLGSPRQLALALTARRYELEHLTNDLVSLGESRVDLKPHQVSVVHRVITNYPHRFLLCDEVGLGKTIEAGLIQELRARGGAERTLIITPPNLIRQWQFELKSKFNETFSILNTDTVRFLRDTQAQTGNPFLGHDSVIVSSSWISGDQWAHLASEVSWDMVIVDEAHHARVRRAGNRRTETRLYRVVRSLVSPDAFSKRSALFLTATPMQLDSGELYSLIEMLDPALFPTEKHFDHHRSRLPGLSRLVHDLSSEGFPPADWEPEVVVERVADWLAIAPEDAEVRLAGGADEVAAICEELSAQHLLSEVLIRNRKKVVGGFMSRHAHRWEVELSEQERTALAAVEAYVRDGYAKADRMHDSSVGFVMVIFQKLMASSIRAFRTSLDRRRQRLESRTTSAAGTRALKKQIEQLEERLDEDEVASDLIAELAVADADEAAELKRLVELLDAVPVDSKAETLVSQLRELRELDPSAKVLLFTEFRETQEYLRERLQSIGWDVQLFHGQLKPDAKDRAVDVFRSATSILLSTEAGGEGRNFQFCHLLVNYDLPWNPMRVEQRIGRVDRIGQTETVQVFNFWVKGTVEERVLNVLERRINIFEDTVGGLDPILGDAERDLAKILRLGGVARERALERFEEQIEQQITQARLADEKLRDFIMETKSYSKAIAALLVEQASPIRPADLERFVTQLLRDVNTYLNARDDGTFEIMFHEPFVSDYPQHVKDHLRRRVVALRPDVQPDSQHVEFMALGHPVVDDLVGRATSDSYPGSSSAVEIEAASDLPPASGWLIVHELGVPALKEVRELRATFVHDQGGADQPLGDRLLLRAAQFPKDRALAREDVPTDGLDPALERAEADAFERLSELERTALIDTTRRIDREREKLAQYFNYREQAARDRLASSATTLQMMETSEQAEQRKIIPVWRANVIRDEQLITELHEDRIARLEQLDQQSFGNGDLRLVAVARVEIIEEDDG